MFILTILFIIVNSIFYAHLGTWSSITNFIFLCAHKKWQAIHKHYIIRHHHLPVKFYQCLGHIHVIFFTWSVAFLSVFPFSDATIRPNILSLVTTSSMVTGQFFKQKPRTIFLCHGRRNYTSLTGPTGTLYIDPPHAGCSHFIII